MFGEFMKMAFVNFVTNRMRTLLSLLGILIGVSSVIIITTLGRSATSNIQGEIASIGMDILAVWGGWGETETESARSRKVFSPQLGAELAAAIEGIAATTPVLGEGNVQAKSRDRMNSFSLNAVAPSYANIFNLETVTGQFWTQEESAGGYPGVVLGNRAAQSLFPAGGAAGSSVKLLIGENAYHFVVLGVLAKRNASMGVSFDNTILMDINFYKTRIARVDFIPNFFLKAANPQEAAGISEQVKRVLSERIPGKDTFWVESPSSITRTFEKITGTLNLALGGIAAISLLVGGIGIMNIMLVSVTERTREIGIRKALGASARVIRNQFLIETSMLTLTGGVIGIALGLGLGKIITTLASLPYVPDMKATLLALIFSAVIGAFFGIYPAVRAARMDPIEALSRE